MSMSHFWDANSAVQITSDEKTSHSPDFASWRWTNCARCSSAEVENSSSLTVTPVFSSLNCLASAVLSPDVSLPRQNVTSPLAPSIDFGSMVLAPSVWPVSSVLAPPPPVSSSSSPQPATTPPISATQPNSVASFLYLTTANPPPESVVTPRGPALTPHFAHPNQPSSWSRGRPLAGPAGCSPPARPRAGAARAARPARRCRGAAGPPW